MVEMKMFVIKAEMEINLFRMKVCFGGVLEWKSFVEG
jgi:hypothetical protein